MVRSYGAELRTATCVNLSCKQYGRPVEVSQYSTLRGIWQR